MGEVAKMASVVIAIGILVFVSGNVMMLFMQEDLNPLVYGAICAAGMAICLIGECIK